MLSRIGAATTGCALAALAAGCAQPMNPPQSAAAPAARTASAQPGMADIMSAQAMLSSLGYTPGAVDGVQGPQTTMALAEFQRSKGLPGTGALDTATLAALRGAVDEAPVGRSAPSRSAPVEAAAATPAATVEPEPAPAPRRSGVTPTPIPAAQRVETPREAFDINDQMRGGGGGGGGGGQGGGGGGGQGGGGGWSG